MLEEEVVHMVKYKYKTQNSDTPSRFLGTVNSVYRMFIRRSFSGGGLRKGDQAMIKKSLLLVYLILVFQAFLLPTASPAKELTLKDIIQNIQSNQNKIKEMIGFLSREWYNTCPSRGRWIMSLPQSENYILCAYKPLKMSGFLFLQGRRKKNFLEKVKFLWRIEDKYT